MKMKVGMIAAVAMAVILCGCGESGPKKPSKAEVRNYIIRKWTKIFSEEQVRAVFHLDTQFKPGVDSSSEMSCLLVIQKQGLGDEFEKDMNLWMSYRGAD